MSELEMSLTDEVFARYHEILERTERLPPQQLAQYQEELLEQLVRHAHANMPFYRDRLACLFAADGTVDLSRWNDVPILRRSDIAVHKSEMCTFDLPAHFGEIVETRTSGTTGPPLPIVVNGLVPGSVNATVARIARWFGMNPSRALATIRRFRSENDAPVPEAAYPEGIVGKRWSYLNPDAPHFSLDLDTPVADQLEWLARRKAPYLLTYPSNAMALAHAVTPEQGRALGIEIVICGAETVPEGARELVAERLGARVAAVYGCMEVGAVAAECPAVPHYHVSAENVLVEILDDDGRDVGPGQRGQVVLTGLYNYAMPFIRYAIGDVAVAGTGPCPCGRSLPVIAQVEGRTRNAFVFRDGARIWPRGQLVRQMRAFVPFAQYQLVQLDYERIELRYVPDGSGRAPDLAGLIEFARGKLHPSITMSVAAMDVLPRGTSGKFEDIVSLVRDAPVAAAEGRSA
jgi:phenylacetate-CoA ligase